MFDILGCSEGIKSHYIAGTRTVACNPFIHNIQERVVERKERERERRKEEKEGEGKRKKRKEREREGEMKRKG